LLFEQIVNVLHTEPVHALNATTAKLRSDLLHGMGPRVELEAMLVCRIIAAHVATMDATRMALHIDQSAAGRSACCANLIATFTLQLDVGRYKAVRSYRRSSSRRCLSRLLRKPWLTLLRVGKGEGT
jgi:hypothetical protein